MSEWARSVVHERATEETWYCCQHGHVLQVTKDKMSGDCYKHIDGHFRGDVTNFALAKEQLEREAAGECSAWGKK